MKAPEAIFELGLNHMGDVGRAIRMVDVLLAQGATHITIQAAIDLSTITRDPASKAMESNCLSLEDVVAVVEHGRDVGAVMGVAILDPDHVKAFIQAGAGFFKVLSSDLTYTQLHSAVARTGLPCYLSTGLATFEDIARAVELIRSEESKADIRLIHTVLQIPTPAPMLNLNNIPALIEEFNVPVAYGQHSDIQDALLAATAVGAETVFVYVAEELSPALPDGPHAMLCSDVKALLEKLNRTRTMMGTKERNVSQEDVKRSISIRRSIVAATPITKGEVITIEKIAFKRPGTGYAPWDVSQALDSRAAEDYLPDEDIR